MSVAVCAIAGAAFAPAGAQNAKLCDKPRQMEGFKTCADVDKAEAEGAFVLYSTDPEQGQVKLLASFNKVFPKIKTSYVRLQAGALYAKVLSERQAKSYLVDVIQISDMGMILDFQRKGGFAQYISPEMAAFKPEYKSKPEGYWTWGSVIMARHRLQPQEHDGRRGAQEVGGPARSEVEGRDQRQGLELGPAARHLVHAEADPGRRLLQAVRRPRSRAPSTPTSSSTAAWSTARTRSSWARSTRAAVEFKAKGAPIGFVFPEPGVPAVSETYGIVADGPHPNAAELFMDWFLSPVGQKALAEALLLHSPREDVPPPGAGAVPLSKMKLLIPADWDAFEKDRPSFAKEWDRIVGARR